MRIEDTRRGNQKLTDVSNSDSKTS